jgi:hypothetical protein
VCLFASLLLYSVLFRYVTPQTLRSWKYSHDKKVKLSLLDSRLTDGGEVASLMHRPAALYPPGRFLVIISVRGWVDTRVIVRLEGLGQLRKSNNLIGNRNRDLLACSIVPQPTTLPRSHDIEIGNHEHINNLRVTKVFRNAYLHVSNK